MSMHKHECPKCETVWQHDPKTFRPGDRPHVCPSCGHIGLPSTYLYAGPKPAAFTNHHLAQETAAAGAV